MIGIMLSNIYRTIDVNIFVPNRITHVSKTKCFLRLLLSLILFSACAVLSFFEFFIPEGYLQWIILALCSAAIVVPFVFLSYFITNRKEVLACFGRIKNIFGRS